MLPVLQWGQIYSARIGGFVFKIKGKNSEIKDIIIQTSIYGISDDDALCDCIGYGIQVK
jgi:hypothetical protein